MSLSEKDPKSKSPDSGDSPDSPEEAVRALAARFDIGALEADPSPMALVRPDGMIVWVNAAWRSFGAANGANPAAIAPGQNYFGVIQGELGPILSSSAASCAASGEVLEVDYDCSSPTDRRDFRMRMLPVPDAGVLISHSTRVDVVAREGEEASAAPDPEAYRTRDGIVVMCSNCRRVRRRDNSGWDWMPSKLVDEMGLISHGLCSLCLDFYYR